MTDGLNSADVVLLIQVSWTMACSPSTPGETDTLSQLYPVGLAIGFELNLISGGRMNFKCVLDIL